MRILLTGATGFLGSHIAEFLVLQNHEIIATKRISSKTVNCKLFYDKVNWVNTDDEQWLNKTIDLSPQIIIHAAWSGVDVDNRNNAEVQKSNLDFLNQILIIADTCQVLKFIGLGSQAEYGTFDYEISENHACHPVDLYAITKLSALKLIADLLTQKHINWYWLRVFSVIGKNDNSNWLLPHIKQNLVKGLISNLTQGEQCYDYLYIDDFLARLNTVITQNNAISGIYNLCSGRAVEIKSLLINLANKLHVSTDLLQFGTIPYRKNQSMYMVGSTEKYEKEFGIHTLLSIDQTLSKFIES